MDNLHEVRNAQTNVVALLIEKTFINSSYDKLYVSTEKLIDKYIGGALVSAMQILPKRELPTIKRVLLIKYRAIGDSIATLSLLKELAKNKIQVEVWCHSSNAAVYEQAFVKRVLLSRKELLSAEKYDAIIDAEPWSNLSAVIARSKSMFCVGFSHALRSKAYDATVLYNKEQHITKTYMSFLDVLGVKKPAKIIPVSIVVSKKDETFAKKLGKYIVIAPGVGPKAKSREWFSDRWAKLVDSLTSNVVLIGHGSDVELVNHIYNLISDKKKVTLVLNKPLATIAAVIKSAKCFIGCDSGPLHVASAMNTPSVGLFGANTPVIWGSISSKNVAIWHKNSMVPCIDNTQMDEPRDESGAIKAMQDISVDEVLSAVKHVSNK